MLVYSRTNTDGPRRPRESSELVEVDLAGSHSRLALGTDSPLSSAVWRKCSLGTEHALLAGMDLFYF